VAPRLGRSAAFRYLFCAAIVLFPLGGHAQTSYRKLGELELRLTGLTAFSDPTSVTVPKNTTSGVRISIRSGASDLSSAEAARLLGGAFVIEGELTGPGLRSPVHLPQQPLATGADPFILNIPPLTQPGDYSLSNLRVTVSGATALDVAPQKVPISVIDQVLITSVTTRPLTLEEIRQKGIVLDSNAYLGFEFTLGLSLDSRTTEFTFPVVFDKRGVAVPQPALPPMVPERAEMPPLTTIVPMLLKPPGEDVPEPTVTLPNGEKAAVRIPSVLVIPGNVGYLKQFFSAKLFVANGAPGASNLTVHDVIGKIKLPTGADRILNTIDDPLSLPDTNKGPQSSSLPVLSAGLDGKLGTGDDIGTFAPGQQGETEFLIRGEKEGFHTIDFDVEAMLDGLITGPVKVAGSGQGGVLVRNPYFDMTFTAPAVVRNAEHFTLFVTVNNISQSLANAVSVTLDSSRLSGAHLVGPGTLTIDTIAARDSRTLQFQFQSDRSGQLVATYLNFDTQNGTTGNLKFTLGVGERGVPLSPDTLVLPAATSFVPQDVLNAAMRVLGQAWSVTNAPSGTLPSGVIRTTKEVVTQKALALAEAGLRINLGQPQTDAVRDLLFDFYGGSPVDAGFDQVLRTTSAGTELARAIGIALQGTSETSGGAAEYERQVAQIAASGSDFVSFAVGNVTGAPVTMAIIDAQGRRASSDTTAATLTASEIPSAVIVPFGTTPTASRLGVIASPVSPPYRLEMTGTGSGTINLSVTVPNGNGSFIHATASNVPVTAGAKYSLGLDPGNPLVLQIDADANGNYETSQPLTSASLFAQGPRLLSATVIGPETLAGAAPFGFNTAVLIDRLVDTASSSNVKNYTIVKNTVLSARRQLSGRLVFLTLEQPEGPYVLTQLAVANIADGRNVLGPPATTQLRSRLTDIGAVVSGRVFYADGTPVRNLALIYAQNPELTCAPPLDDIVGLTQTRTDDNGRYELRYVRQDACGLPFQITTNDPNTGAPRTLSSSVRVAGEQIVLDIAIFGRGSVTGTVRNLTGSPVAGADVVAISQTDPQSNGSTKSDTSGRYRIDNITVGPVTVHAVQGASLGRSNGRIDRAGTAAVIDLTLDGGTVRASGIVRKVQGALITVVPSVQVVYYVRSSDSLFIPVALTTTDTNGAYAFEGMPTGEYRIEAAINSRDKGAATGIAAAADVLVRDIAIVIGGDSYGTIRGTVKFPDGMVAGGVVVSIDDRGVLSNADGSFELSPVVVKPFEQQRIVARSRDGLRAGMTSVLISQPNQILSNVVVILSGIGTAEFTVFDAGHNPIADQDVALLGECANPCGCVSQKTDTNGKVRFEGVPLGTAVARATRAAFNSLDQATATATILSDGGTAFGVMQFTGFGSVTGTVLNPDNSPALGANVTLIAKVFDEDSCSLIEGIAQRVRTDSAGKFRFTGVNVGNVSVGVSHPFFTTNVGARGTLSRNGDTVDFALKLVNTISGILSGIVYLPDGHTPAGAGVEVTAFGPLPDVTVTTDENGRYQFAKIFPEGTYNVTARDSVTGGLRREQIYLRASQDVIHDFRLKGRGTVNVKVVNGAGQPVTTSAFVRLEESEYPNRTYETALEAANNGVATFTNVFEGPLTATASDAFARGGRASSVLASAGATLDMTVAMTTTGTVKGHFYQTDGLTPIPFGGVRLVINGTTTGQATTNGTDDVGAFSFSYVPAGPVRLEAQDPQTARSGVAAGSVTTEGEIVTLDIKAQGLGTVQGLVTSNAAAQPGAQVMIDAGQIHASTMTDASGRYSIGGLPEGRVVATASLSGNFLTGTNSGLLSGEASTLTLDVALRDSGKISGKVVKADGVTAAPLSYITALASGATLSTTSDTQGNFTFDRVPIGSVSLSASVLGGIDQGTATTDVVANATANVTVTLNGVGSIAGRALDSGGLPIAGDITVTGSGAFPYSFTVQSQADGNFALTQVLAGPFTASLRAKSGEFFLYGTTSSSVAAGQTANITVQVQPSGTVTALVVRSNGTTPAVGANVTLQLDPNRGTVSLQTGTDGRFTARGVPLGAFTVRVNDPITTGLALAHGTLMNNGDTVEIPTMVLDDKPLTVLSVTPADGTTGVAINASIVLTFSNSLQSAAGISVLNGANAIGLSASLSADGKTVTLTGTWPDSKELTVLVSTATTDIFGRHPLASFSTKFRTIDLTPPGVAAIAPNNDAVQQPATTAVAVTFNEPLGAATNLSTLIVITGANNIVLSGTSALTGPATVTFTPAALLADNAVYNVLVNGAIDLAGNVQTVPFTSKFATTDTGLPTIVRTQPSSAWVNTAKPYIEFATTDSVSGINAASGTLAIDGQTVTPARSATTISYTPPVPLAEGSHAIAATVADRASNSASASATFAVDTVAPSEATLSGVTEGQTIRGMVTISATATDAGSGVGSIQLLSDNSVIATLTGPQFSTTFNTAALTEGNHSLSGRAIDVAGNTGPSGTVVHVNVDNLPLSVAITAPPVNGRVRNQVTVTAVPSELVASVAFTVAGQTVTDMASPYEATFDVSALADSTQTINVTATSAAGEMATATRNFFVDHTPPLAPDASRISAEPPSSDGRSLVYGLSGAVEGNALVEIVNTTHPASVTVTAAGDGTFSNYINGAIDDILTITATDTVGNRGPSTNISIRRTPSLPPAQGSTTLRFDGVLVDRVGNAGGAVTPDGKLDAVFVMTMSIGDGVTRQLSYIDLTGNGTRSTRTGNVVLGVAVDAGAPLLNSPNGTLSLPVTSGTTLTLFAADEGFIRGETTYTVTAVFTDGSRFVGTCFIQEDADHIGVPHSATITTPWASVIGSATTPGTTTITMSNIRDIEGQLVPDGTKIAVSAASGASKNPLGDAIASAGGNIVDGVAAPNNSAFKVFTISGGQVTATYSTGSVVSATVSNAFVTVQVIAADASGNVIGTEAIATTLLNLSGSTFRAQLNAAPTALYGDRADRRAHVTIRVNDTNGNPVADGTKVLVSAADCFARFSNNACYGSAGGAVLGGTGPNNRVFTVSGGVVQADYSSAGLGVGSGGWIIPAIQVLPADANGNATSSQPIGLYSLQIVGAGAAEVDVAPDTMPYVEPVPSPARVRVHHVHDILSNLLPEDANILVSAADCASRFRSNACVGSSGGVITDGTPSPSGSVFRVFALMFGDIQATYSSQGFNAVVPPGQSRDATIQVLMADNTGALSSSLNLGRATIHVVGPLNALTSVNPTVLFGDGRLQTSTVTFDHILDTNGNPLPEGSKVISSAADCAGRFASNACISSEPGSLVLNGDASPSGTAYKVFTITNGKVVVQYGAQGIAVAPGASKTGRVVLLGAYSNGLLLSSFALAYAEITLIGTTSGQGSISPAAIHADGRDFRAAVTFSNFKDRDGRPVPDGTRIGLSATDCAARFASNACVSSAGGSIIGGDAAPFGSAYRIFSVTNGQIVAEYSSQNVVAINTLTATAVAVSVDQNNNLLSNFALATASVRLLAPGSAMVSVSPVDIAGTGVTQTSNIIVSNLKDVDTSVPVPDGTKIALSAVNCASRYPSNACVSSVGGDILPVGTVPGDGTSSPSGSAYKVFTVSGGEIRATYSATGLWANPGATNTATIQVLPANKDGNLLHTTEIGLAEIKLHGTTSATASGPTAIPRSGGTASVTFAGIRDSAGNLVPDGTIVVVSVTSCAMRFSSNACIDSAGGTITNGTDSPSGGALKYLTVMNGSVIVNYSTAGADPSKSTVNIQIGAAQPDGQRIGSIILVGGTHTMTLQ